MGAKKIVYGEEARERLLEGIDTVANAIKVTLGPAARTVVLEKSWGSPSIINDGVTIAKDIELGEPFANMGAKLIQEVASKTQDNAGDGTSTASILAQKPLPPRPQEHEVRIEPGRVEGRVRSGHLNSG